ncbi:MAG: exo-beta-N-acetylmuramidase NamZ family protein [Colwellia sp.]
MMLTFFSVNAFAFEIKQSSTVSTATKQHRVVVGAERFSNYLPLLKNKRVGLVVNQTSMVGNKHLVDALLEKGIDIQMIFAPEHGFRGELDAGETFDNNIDPKTGTPIYSIYGKRKKPELKVMEKLDVVVFDIQDVGVRFYTYISSMHYMMEVSADAKVSFIVLDRPNPNGMFIDGPILTPKLNPEFTSFVGMHKIPLVHGLTVGELALMIKGEGWLKTDKNLSLKVIKSLNYDHGTIYNLPVKPSPNLPNQLSIFLYASLGFFEATPISIGRGTKFPFQVIGHNAVSIGDFEFTPISMPGSAVKPKLMGKKLTGQNLAEEAGQKTAEQAPTVTQTGLDLSFLIAWHKAFDKEGKDFFDRPDFMDKLSGTDKLRKSILANQTEIEIRQQWAGPLRDYLSRRKPYLLYPDVKYYFEPIE